MKCPNCNFENHSESTYCQECGHKLHHENKSHDGHHHNPSIATEIEDVLFIPKRKDRSGLMLLLLLLGGIVGGYYLLTNSGDTNQTLSIDTPTPTLSSFPLSCLTLKDEKMYRNSYYVQNPTFKAVLYNSCDEPAKDVIIRVNFYKVGAENGDGLPSDTEYVQVADYIGARDASSIDIIIKTNVDTAKDFRWTAGIYTAEGF